MAFRFAVDLLNDLFGDLAFDRCIFGYRINRRCRRRFFVCFVLLGHNYWVSFSSLVSSVNSSLIGSVLIAIIRISGVSACSFFGSLTDRNPSR